jgi:hypothetical protein
VRSRPPARRSTDAAARVGIFPPGLDVDVFELDRHRLGVPTAVRLVVTGEGRRFDLDADGVGPVPGHREVHAVVVQAGMPDVRHLDGSDRVTVLRDERRADVQFGDEPAVCIVTDGDFEVAVLLVGVEPLQTVVARVVHPPRELVLSLET